MLVEGGEYLNTLWTVMDLMKCAPQEPVSVAPPVPPVEDKRSEEVGDETVRG